jgi:hypothetical protein
MRENVKEPEGEIAHKEPKSDGHICAMNSIKQKKMRKWKKKKKSEKNEKKETKQDKTHAKWGVTGRDDAGGPVVPGRAIFRY